MKNFSILIPIGILMFLSHDLKSQCDQLSLDTLYVNSDMETLNGSIRNDGSLYIIYPFVTISLEANPYLLTHMTHSVPSYLDSAGGLNNGLTFFINDVTILAPPEEIPLNTILDGQLLIEHPMDTTLRCTINFSWNVSADKTSSSEDLPGSDPDRVPFDLFPNPSIAGQITLSRVDHHPGSLQIVHPQSGVVFQKKISGRQFTLDTSALFPGIYLVRYYSQELKCWFVKSILIF